MKRYVGMYLIVVVMLLLLSCGGGGGGGGATSLERIKSVAVVNTSQGMSKAIAGFDSSGVVFTRAITYTGDGKLDTVIDKNSANNIVGHGVYTYDAEGKIDYITDPTFGQTTYYSYFTASEAHTGYIKLVERKATVAGTHIISWTYEYNISDQLIKITQDSPLVTVDFSYYTDGKLQKTIYTEGTGVVTYTYFYSGNLIDYIDYVNGATIRRYKYNYNEDNLVDNIVRYIGTVVDDEIQYDYEMEAGIDATTNAFFSHNNNVNPVLLAQ